MDMLVKAPVPTQETSKRELVFAAAKTLAGLPEDVVAGIASASAGKFVQAVRKTYKRFLPDFSFTDDDLRDIHGLVQQFARQQMKLREQGGTKTVQ